MRAVCSECVSVDFIIKRKRETTRKRRRHFHVGKKRGRGASQLLKNVKCRVMKIEE